MMGVVCTSDDNSAIIGTTWPHELRQTAGNAEPKTAIRRAPLQVSVDLMAPGRTAHQGAAREPR